MWKMSISIQFFDERTGLFDERQCYDGERHLTTNWVK